MSKYQESLPKDALFVKVTRPIACPIPGRYRGRLENALNIIKVDLEKPA